MPAIGEKLLYVGWEEIRFDGCPDFYLRAGGDSIVDELIETNDTSRNMPPLTPSVDPPS